MLRTFQMPLVNLHIEYDLEILIPINSQRTVIMNLQQNTTYARGSEYFIFTCIEEI